MTASQAIRRQRRVGPCGSGALSHPGAQRVQSLEKSASAFSSDWIFYLPVRATRVGHRFGSRSGQAILESCIIVVLMSLMLFGMIEIARLFAGKEVLNYAATVGARAHSVGFNDFMIFKTVRVAAIPVAGKITQPTVTYQNPGVGAFQGLARAGQKWDYAVQAHPNSTQYDTLEASRIPLYLGAEDYGQLAPILNYEDWEHLALVSLDDGDTLVNTGVRQDVQLKFAFHRAFWGADEVPQAGNVTMDSHYQLYLDPVIQSP